MYSQGLVSLKLYCIHLSYSVTCQMHLDKKIVCFVPFVCSFRRLSHLYRDRKVIDSSYTLVLFFQVSNRKFSLSIESFFRDSC